MGALAAAGLEGLHGMQADHVIARGIDHGSTMTPLHTTAAAPEAHVEGSRVASLDASHPMLASESVHAPQHGTQFHDMVQTAHSLGHADGPAAQAVAELLQASATSVHASGGHAAMTAAAIAMPSAEQLLAAAAGAHGVVQPQTSVAGNAAQHNEVVSKVLADSLHGGEGHGTSIDAVVNGLSGHGAAHDALAALASHIAAAVPFGHMGFASAFGGANVMLSPEMHPDNVAPVHG
jgi:hypothetical protein